jgi:hypothetical protein
MKRVLLITAILALCATLARAQAAPTAPADFTGNDLLEKCRHDDSIKDTGCMMFIQGFINGAEAFAPKRYFSVPNEATLGQVRDVVLKYIVDHPAERHQLAGVLITWALHDAFPVKADVAKQ